MWDIRYNLDDIVVKLTPMQHFMVSDLDIGSIDQNNEEEVINVVPLSFIPTNPGTPQNNSQVVNSLSSPVIILG